MEPVPYKRPRKKHTKLFILTQGSHIPESIISSHTFIYLQIELFMVNSLVKNLFHFPETIPFC